MTFSLDAAIKNIYTSLFGGGDDEEEVTKEKPKSGLMSSNIRPKSRPANLELVEAPARESVTQAIKGIGDNTTTDDTVGVGVSAVGVNMNAAKLYGTYNTPAHKLISLNKDRDPTSDKFKVLSVQQDEFFDGYLKKLQNELGGRVLRPKARPLSRAERRASYKYSEKDKIMDMQQALNARGITVNGKQLVEDGIRGNNTIKAIKSFQKEEGLIVDGIAGKNTRSALLGAAPVYEVTQSGLSNQAEINAAQKASEQRSVMENLSMAAEAYEVGDIPTFVGDTDQDTKEGRVRIQEALNDLGYSVGEADGIFGPKTKKGIQEFKKDNGLLSSLNKGGLDVDINKDTVKALNDARKITMGADNETPDAVKAGIFEGVGNFLENFGTTEFRFFANNLLNAGEVFTEDNVTNTDIDALRKAVSNAIKDKRKYTKYEDLGQDELEVNKKGPFAGLMNPELRMARSLGVFKFDKDKEGNIIINDTFDYNDGPKRIAYLKAVEAGDKPLVRSLLLDASPVQAASMIGYAKQEQLKKAGKPFQTTITINLGNPETWDTDTEQGLMSNPAEAEPVSTVQNGEETTIEKLTVSYGTRVDFPPTKDMFNVSLDYNSYTGLGKASGTEVIIPDNADKATKNAAIKFNKAMVAFATKHGIKDYKNRGIFTTTQNAARKDGKRGGVSNTVHAEPFFIQDKKMVAIVNNNFEEFSKIYVGAFGGLPARMVAPHGVGSDVGRASEEFGSETEFGKRVIATLMGS